ncbi:Alpha/beta hydrolase family protein [Hymenobacter gelipurpurascens]|uniref:Alpha/beta hydrolase family protein n=1 Tax=Hymenobacter gelipurpurascens TaxID=89968 RepID=A0A212U8Y9_9BACT|nr:alpha/beta hydrolase [Hymenobacter gelipurpurascens]SNC74620.1 Alpha/beta hydrolase family protein [Hymenobacter gelipurpurascens]
MTETQDPSNSIPAAGPSRWRRAAAAVGWAARAPLTGVGFLYRAGQENLHFTLPVLNGAFGDQLAARHDPRAIQMSFRRHEADVPVADLRLSSNAAGNPQKTVVFLHGLMGDEIIWQAGSPDGLRYGPSLQQELGVCCLYVRYNSGLHISENGRLLHQLLSELVHTFPEAVGELVLVGHSMGGLIIRSAGYYADQELKNRQPEHEQTSSWLGHLRNVLLLGVPNDGSFLEQNSYFTSLILRKINIWPTRFVSGLIDKRSNGIKDLRFARLIEEDWQNPNADDLFPPRTVVPLLPGVHYHVLAGSLLKSDTSVLHDYFGDGLVGAHSAQGRIFRDPAAPADLRISTQVFPKLHHGSLLSHPEVYAYLRDVVAQENQRAE